MLELFPYHDGFIAKNFLSTRFFVVRKLFCSNKNNVLYWIGSSSIAGKVYFKYSSMSKQTANTPVAIFEGGVYIY